MTAQGADVDVLDGLAMRGMIAIHTASSLSAAKINPVDGFVAGHPKTRALDQGFKQQRPILVQALPIFGQMLSGERKNHARKTANGNVRRNEEAAVGDDELKVPFVLFCVPADPGVARRHRPRRTRKLQAGQIAAGQSFGLDEITQVSAERDTIADIMPSFDELFENRIELLVGSLNEPQRQRFELSGAAGDRRLQFDMDGRSDPARTGRAIGATLGYRDNPVDLKTFQQGAAFLVFQFSAGTLPFQQFTKGLG